MAVIAISAKMLRAQGGVTHDEKKLTHAKTSCSLQLQSKIEIKIQIYF